MPPSAAEATEKLVWEKNLQLGQQQLVKTLLGQRSFLVHCLRWAILTFTHSLLVFVVNSISKPLIVIVIGKKQEKELT